MKFGTRSLVLPSERYFEFVNILRKAAEAYESKSQEPFEEIIFEPTKLHRLVGIYQEYEGSWNFSLRLLWNMGQDKRWAERLAKGQVQPIPSETGWVYLTRGSQLDEHQVHLLRSQLKNLMERTCFITPEAARQIQDFLSHIYNHDQRAAYVKEKLSSYGSMNFTDKKKILDDLVSAMYLDLKLDLDDYSKKNLVDLLTVNWSLIFALLNHNHL